VNVQDHPYVEKVETYLNDEGISPETLRYAATHEALCRSWIFDLLTGLADVLEKGTDVPAEHIGGCNEGCDGDNHLLLGEDLL
jgi:hypothetical protein